MSTQPREPVLSWHRRPEPVRYTEHEVKAAVDVLICEDDYSPEDAQRRILQLLREARVLDDFRMNRGRESA